MLQFKKLPDIKKQIQILSVQHSGSRSLRKIFISNGYDFVDIKHFTKPYHDIKFAVAPIRDPIEVYRSWVSKGRTEDFFNAWWCFEQTYLLNPNVWIIPVDIPSLRNKYLENLGEYLHINFVTDWEIVGHTKRKKEIEIPDLSEIYKLAVVSNFYSFPLDKI